MSTFPSSVWAAKPALVIPALNEEDVIASTLRSIPAGLFHVVVVADNGSTDRTGDIARAEGALVAVEPRRGYGAACLAAIAALPAESDAVVFLQADGSEDPALAARLLAPIREGKADMVLGSRTLGDAEPGALEPHQRFGNWLATTLMYLVYRHRYTDLGPFRAIRRDALDHLRMKDQDYGWTIEMQIRALQHGLRVLEIPIPYGNRRAGQGKVTSNMTASIQAGIKIIWTVFRLAVSGKARGRTQETGVRRE